MTRKDFILIAESLASTRPVKAINPKEYTAKLEQWRDTVIRMATVLMRTNHRFDRERFLKACGIE